MLSFFKSHFKRKEEPQKNAPSYRSLSFHKQDLVCKTCNGVYLFDDFVALYKMFGFRIISGILKLFVAELPSSISAMWFTICVLGFIRRSDHYGVSTFVRACHLPAGCYERLLSFFRKSPVKIERLELKWWKIVVNKFPRYKINDKKDDPYVLVIDGTKVQKEGRRMPAVKKLGQTSEDQTKPTYIHGIMFQCISILCSKGASLLSVPLAMHIVDGVKATSEWENSPYGTESQLVQAANDVIKIAEAIKKSIIVIGDRYYLSREIVRRFLDFNKENIGCPINLITKVKKNYCAYFPLTDEQKKDKRRKKGDKVKLFDLFDGSLFKLKEIKINLYQKVVKARVGRIDLLWGTGLYTLMSFVFVEYWDETENVLRREIITSMDTSLSTETIIKLYTYRFKIEVQFKASKSVLEIFSFRFWSKFQPYYNKKRKKGDPDPLESVVEPNERKCILETLHATELFVFCGVVAQGIVQLIALQFSEKGDRSMLRFQRTPAGEIPSEENIREYIKNNFDNFINNNPNDFISRTIIKARNSVSWDERRAQRRKESAA